MENFIHADRLDLALLYTIAAIALARSFFDLRTETTAFDKAMMVMVGLAALMFGSKAVITIGFLIINLF